MNQILQTDSLDSNKKNNMGAFGRPNNTFNPNNSQNGGGLKGGISKLGIDTIVKIFAISLIVFGVATLGNGVYAKSKISKIKENQKIPNVSISRKGNVLNLTVKSEVALRSVGYAWNGEDFQYSSAKQQKQFNMNIKVIDGSDNKLNIAVVDMSNKKSTYHSEYSKEPDTTNPEIVISNADPKIKITVTDDTALDHVTYKYGDDQEQRIEADPRDPSKLEFYIDNVDTEQKTLLVEAVDSSQNHAEKEEKVVGTTKPKIELGRDSQDPSIIQIRITDTINLHKVVIYKNDQRFDTSDSLVSINDTVYTAKVRVNSGDVLKIEAHNMKEKMASETYNF